MKFEIQDPAAIDEDEQPWPTAVLEELPARTTEFVPFMDGSDGMPHPTEDGGFFMARIGSYQTVERPRKVWTIEIATIEDLMRNFSFYDITIMKSKVVGCAGLLEFEEPPSTASSCS